MTPFEPAYFYHPYGLRNRGFLPEIDTSSVDLISRTEEQVRLLLEVLRNGKLLFGTNIASLTAAILGIVKPTHTIFGPHELKWNKHIFGTGILHEYEKEFTYPNRFFSESHDKKPDITKVSSEFIIGDQKNLKNSDAYYVSRISRLTGKPLITPEGYRSIKKNTPNCTVLVDGAQTVGAVMENVSEFCDIFLGLSSKFIGANPHLAFAWISDQVLRDFPDLKMLLSVDKKVFEIDYLGLLYHAKMINQLHAKNLLMPEIKKKKQLIESMLASLGYEIVRPKNQPPHFVTFYVGNTDKTKLFEEKMLQNGVLVTSTLGGWSFQELEKPLIRLGINYETTEEDITRLEEAMQKTLIFTDRSMSMQKGRTSNSSQTPFHPAKQGKK